MLVSIMSVVAVFKSVAQKSFDHIIGRWLSDDKTIEVEIYKSGNEYNGKIIQQINPIYQDPKPIGGCTPEAAWANDGGAAS